MQVLQRQDTGTCIPQNAHFALVDQITKETKTLIYNPNILKGFLSQYPIDRFHMTSPLSKIQN